MDNFDKFVFLSDCKKFYANIADSMRSMGIYEEGRLEQTPVDFDKSTCLVDSAEQYMTRQIEGGQKLPGTSDKTVFFSTKRSVTSEDGKYYENILTVVKHGDYTFTKIGRPIEIPADAVQKAEELTSKDYKYKEMGWSVKIHSIIKECYNDHVPDAWNWANNDKFGHHCFGLEGVKCIQYAVVALYAHFYYNSGKGLILNATQLPVFLDWIVSEVKTFFGELVDISVIVASGQISKSWAAAVASKLNRGVALLQDGNSGIDLPQGSSVLVFVDGSQDCQSEGNAIVQRLRSQNHTVQGQVIFNCGCKRMTSNKPERKLCLF